MIIPMFLDKVMSAEKLAQVDDFIDCQTLFNINLISDKLKTKDEYRSYLSKTTLDWPNRDVVVLKEIFVEINKKLSDLGLNIRQEVLLIRTNGEDSWNLPYTRQNAIILPSKQDDKELLGHNNIHLITHELFHILSRENPEIRKDLYAIYNFIKMETEVDVQSFIPTMITNPDALHFHYYTDVEYKNKTYKALPIMLHENGKFNWKKLLILDTETNKPSFCVNMKKTSYVKDKSTVTTYITHPEEISAEMFREIVCDGVDNKNEDKAELLTAFYKILKEFYK